MCRCAFCPPSSPKHSEDHRMKIRHIIADAIGVACIFGAGYGLLLIGHGLGL